MSQSIQAEVVGPLTREQLRPTNNLKAVFRSMRSYLAANAVGMTRDQPLARQMMNLVFCKIYDERFTGRDAAVSFRADADEPAVAVADRVKGLFQKVVDQYDDVFALGDQIELDDRSIAHVVSELQQFCLIECDRDVVGDAFETFIGPSLKGGYGQFFTPQNVTRLARALVRPQYTDVILDPACGSGGFLVEALRGLWERVDEEADKQGWTTTRRAEAKRDVAVRQVLGIDKDEFLSKVAKAYMALLGDSPGAVHCENSLAPVKDWASATRQQVTPWVDDGQNLSSPSPRTRAAATKSPKPSEQLSGCAAKRQNCPGKQSSWSPLRRRSELR